MEKAFRESAECGLIAIASRSADGALPGSLAFWREFAREFFLRLCHHGTDPETDWRKLPAPSADWLQRLVDEAPPMPGLEYLSPDLLRALWDRLREAVIEQARSHSEGPAAFLQSLSPLWHLVGRVTFHLAENKRNSERPFAFLATFAHRVSPRARLQHLPLGEALRQYAGERNRDALQTLLDPVRRASDRSSLVRESGGIQ